MQEWEPAPGVHLSLPDFFGARVEGTIELGPLMVDVNADLLFFPETGELALFLSNPISFQVQPKQVSWGGRREHDERYRMGRGENSRGLRRFCLGSRRTYSADGAPYR